MSAATVESLFASIGEFHLAGATHPLVELDPNLIAVKRIPMAQCVHLQSLTSKAVWRPAPGRKNPYAVTHDGRIVGIMFLASPVINLGVRDAYLELPREGKGTRLRTVADMSICVGIQPLAWHWNLGKLVAMLATSTQIADDWKTRYGDDLEWITTTSLWGRGTQYNRVYKYLGLTKGYGHAHVSDTEYSVMLEWMAANDVPIPSCVFGAGSNARMRRIAAYQRARGEKVSLNHGQRRGVYIHRANVGTVEALTCEWYARWGLPRYERTKNLTPPYATGLE